MAVSFREGNWNDFVHRFWAGDLPRQPGTTRQYWIVKKDQESIGYYTTKVLETHINLQQNLTYKINSQKKNSFPSWKNSVCICSSLQFLLPSFQLTTNLHLRKLKWQWKSQPFEDVYPINNCDFPASHVGFRGSNRVTPRNLPNRPVENSASFFLVVWQLGTDATSRTTKTDMDGGDQPKKMDDLYCKYVLGCGYGRFLHQNDWRYITCNHVCTKVFTYVYLFIDISHIHIHVYILYTQMFNAYMLTGTALLKHFIPASPFSAWQGRFRQRISCIRWRRLASCWDVSAVMYGWST